MPLRVACLLHGVPLDLHTCSMRVGMRGQNPAGANKLHECECLGGCMRAGIGNKRHAQTLHAPVLRACAGIDDSWGAPTLHKCAFPIFAYTDRRKSPSALTPYRA
eukprot:352239-Chlamydomonas_euryale.AAC.5